MMSNSYAIPFIAAWSGWVKDVLLPCWAILRPQRRAIVGWNTGLAMLMLIMCCYQVQAQVPPANVEYDQDIAQFKDKQEKISRMFTKQQQRLVKLNERIQENKVQLNKLVELLKYPKNVPKHKDAALTQLVEIRKRNDDDKQILQEMYFEWLKFEIDITSIYARYGELNLIQKVDTDLKAFLQLHRTLVQDMGNAMGNIKYIYNEADYLLSAKLE
jgi:septal ring factor EnvC (AmiA/AmiB activator)